LVPLAALIKSAARNSHQKTSQENSAAALSMGAVRGPRSPRRCRSLRGWAILHKTVPAMIIAKTLKPAIKARFMIASFWTSHVR